MMDARPDARPQNEWLDLAEEAGQLREALQTRAPIEQAKGILTLLRGVDPETAWVELNQVSQEENVKVRDLAAALVSYTGGRSVRAHDGSPAPLAAAAAVKSRWAPALQAFGARPGPGCEPSPVAAVSID